MLTFIAFVLTILGCINWLMIGLLQYDFVAGLFGWQSSMMSRLVYIAIGIGAIYFTLRVLLNKGTVKVWERKKQPAAATVEKNEVVKSDGSGKKKKFWQFWKKKTPKKVEKIEKVETTEQDSAPPEENLDEPFSEPKKQEQNNLFDEHLNG